MVPCDPVCPPGKCLRFFISIILLTLVFSARAADSDSLQTAYAHHPAPEIQFRSFPGADQLLQPAIQPGSLFTDASLGSLFPIDPEQNAYRDAAKAEFQKLEQSNRFIDALRPDDLNELPIGLSKTVNNTTVKIAISNATFHASHAELTVYAKLIIPQAPYEIFFGMKGIKLSYDGGILGDAKLILLGDLPIRLNGGTAALVLKGGLNMETGQGIDLTYVTMDCAGFKELGLTAEVMFPRSMLVPLKADGERDDNPNATVKAGFQTVVSDWNDILVGISLPSFEIAPLKGIGFHIGKAVFDASDIRNSTDIIYPNGYAAKYIPPGSEALWRGVYVEDLEVILPKQFARREQSGRRISFGAQHMIIDQQGLTGNFYANNVLPEGSASGWRFTVDRFEIALEANKLTGAGFFGTVGLPVSKDPLGYTAVITAENEYLLKLTTLNKLSFNVWKAKAELYPNSWVQLKLADGKFQPEAMLHGRMGITASNKEGDTAKSMTNFKGIEFEALHLQTKAPYFTAKYFGYTGEVKLANFPVSLTEIGLSTNGDQASLFFGVKVNLMEKNFGGSTKVHIVGRFGEEGGLQSWKFEKLRLETIAIKADISKALKIEGALTILEDDPTYGDAVGGWIKAGFLDNKVKIEARALFGSKDFRYWYVDAKADLGLGIMVVPPISLQGFGGGAYYRMRKDGVDMLSSPTGVRYVPDENTGLGIKAAVLFSVVKKEVVNGEVSFEVAFNRNGGINFMGFYGYAKILGVIPGLENVEKAVGQQFEKLGKLEQAAIAKLGGTGEALEKLKTADPSKAAENIMGDTRPVGESGLSAYVGIQYDFTKSTFHANFDVYLNIAGVLTGVSSGNRAGWAVFHIEPGSWYFHMGTPTNRLGVKFGIGSVAIKTGAYLMVGDKIPGSPPPPQEVADILGVDVAELDYMRDLNALGDGRGFAFGASLSVETGDLTFLILYANFKAGVGFDIMLKDYGDAHCKGSNEPIGMNGWYANGQAYVYLQGEVGVKVNLLFIKGRFPIISGAAAVLMQAKLPNPTWLRGYMAVKFSILGGLVKGNMRMKVTIGKECEIVSGGNSPVDVKVIADLTPADLSAEVDVFSAPQAAFNMRLNQPFDIEDDNGIKTYRIKLESFTVTDNAQPVPGKLEWNTNNDAVSFYSKEVLPPKKQLKALVKVSFEQLTNGAWQTLYLNGKKSEEEKLVTFTTGTAPDFIPLHNIAYAYPVVDQQNFYPAEYGKGYIRLKRGQSYLFDPKWKFAVHLAKTSTAPVVLDMNYNTAEQQINYVLPDVNNSANYQFDLIAMPPGATAAASEVAAYEKTDAGEDGDYSVKKNSAKNVTRGDVTKSLLGYAFHSSRYNTFARKMENLRIERSLADRVLSDVISLQTEVGKYEPFDIPELTGTGYTNFEPLVQTSAILTDGYYKEDIHPLLYANYPIHPEVQISNRDTEVWGVVPAKAMSIMNGYVASLHGGTLNSWQQNKLPYVYDLPLAYKHDFVDLQYQVVNRFLGTPEQAKYHHLILGTYPFIRYGKYKVQYQYRLPDGQPGSVTIIEYSNPVK